MFLQYQDNLKAPKHLILLVIIKNKKTSIQLTYKFAFFKLKNALILSISSASLYCLTLRMCQIL